MLIYLLLFAFVCYFVFSVKPEDQALPNNRYRVLFVIIVVALVCGFRDMLGGYDNYIYGQIFDVSSLQLKQGVPFFKTYAITLNSNEMGYGIYNLLIGLVFSNRYIFFLITALLYFTLLYRHFTKYSKYPFIFFFVYFCMHYFFSFTYIREILACSIVWFSIPYAVNRKPQKFFLIVLLAASFHNSALLFGIVYFMANRKFKLSNIYVGVLITFLIGLTPVGTFLMQHIGGAINEEKAMISANAANESGGARIEYLFEALFFLFLLRKVYYKLPKDNFSLCMTNIGILFVFTLLFFIRFTDGGRLSWYFIIGGVYISTEVCVHKLSDSYVKPLTYLLMTFLYFRIVFAWGNQLSPYKTFFENSVRDNDEIWEKYEYDHEYDNDKLYKI